MGGTRCAVSVIIATLVLVACAGWSCRIEESPPDDGRAEGDALPDAAELPGDAAGGEVRPDPAAAALFAGTWAQYQVVSHISNFPGYNAVATLSRMWQLVEATAEGSGHLSVRETMCDLAVETPDMPVDTIIPQTFVDNLVPTGRRIAVEGSAGAWRAESDVMTEVRGCLLDDPVGERLPFSPDDERVVDQDRDGHPGMTLNFTGAVNAQVYVVQRWDSRFFAGSATGTGRLEGLVYSRSEQQIIDATNAALDGPDPDPAEWGSWPDPVAAHSTFLLVRLPEGAGCDDVLSAGLGD